MKIAAGHAWNVWPDPEPETVARWQSLIDDLHAEFDQGQMRVFSIVERHRAAIEAEATAAALAPYVAALRTIAESRTVAGECVWCMGPTGRHLRQCPVAVAQEALASPLSVREAGLDVAGFVACPECGRHVHRLQPHLREVHGVDATPERPADESRKP